MKAVLILIIIVVYSSLQEDDCCFRKTVAGTDTLDGTYIFLRKFDPPSSKVAECVDVCIYSRDVPGHEGEEYCFTPTLDGAVIDDQCEAPPTQSPPSPCLLIPTLLLANPVCQLFSKSLNILFLVAPLYLATKKNVKSWYPVPP